MSKQAKHSSKRAKGRKNVAARPTHTLHNSHACQNSTLYAYDTVNDRYRLIEDTSNFLIICNDCIKCPRQGKLSIDTVDRVSNPSIYTVENEVI